MKESHGEGVANYTGSESCGIPRKRGDRSVDRRNYGPET